MIHVFALGCQYGQVVGSDYVRALLFNSEPTNFQDTLHTLSKTGF